MTSGDATLDTVPTPDALDGRWLTTILAEGGRHLVVDAVTATRVGTGQLGDTYRLTLCHDGDGPRTLIAKFAAVDPASRAIARAWTLYEREVLFYRMLAPSARIDVPTLFGSRIDADGGFMLLLEDLAPATTGDQFRGMTFEEGRRAMSEAARLHAAFWNRDDDPVLGWLETGPLAQPFYDANVFRSAWPAFRDRYADRLDGEHLRVGDLLSERYEGFSRPLDRPRCVTHNDFRPDNMLFGADGRLTVVDWQSVAFGYNAVDVSYMIGGAYTPADRRDVEDRLLATYLETLHAQGVDGYSAADLRADYRHFAFAGMNVAVGAAMMVKRTDRGDGMFLTMLDRHVRHVLDTGALDILHERG